MYVMLNYLPAPQAPVLAWIRRWLVRYHAAESRQTARSAWSFLMSSRMFDILWVLVLGLLSSIWCVSVGREIGPTFDEPFYLEGGLHFWRTGSFGPLLQKGTMPLPIAVFSAPI